MAVGADLPADRQRADAKGRGAVAVNVAQYGSATIYQNVVRLTDAQLGVIAARLREASGTEALPSDRTETCPYPGLETFLTSEAEFFAGRDDEVAELVAAVDRFGISASVSASGAGKSSLVNAGLIPALGRRETEKWDIFAFRPGREPLKALSRAISAILERDADHDDRLGVINRRVQSLRTGEVPLRDHLELLRASRMDAAAGRRHQVLFYIDQWEELYIQTDTESDRGDLIRELLDVTERGLAKVLLTMRADFMGDLLNGNNGLLCRLKPGICYLEQMTETSLRAAILKPAAAVDLSVPEDLTSRLVADTRAQPGALPYLQFVLRQLWEQREKASNSLATEAYDKMGGLKGAIGRHASNVLEELTSKEQQLAARIIPRLVNVLDSGEPTSRRLSLADFDEDARTLLRKLADPDKRMIVLGAATDDAADSEIVAEVAHEALLREWNELKGWIADRKDFFRLRNKLEADAKTWKGNKNRHDFLIPSGKPLLDAAELQNDALEGEISEDLEGYLKISFWKDRSRRWTRNGVFVALLIAAIGIATYFADLSGDLQASNESEKLARQEAEGRQIGAEALLLSGEAGTANSIKEVAQLAEESWTKFENLNAYLAASRVIDSLPVRQITLEDEVSLAAYVQRDNRVAFVKKTIGTDARKLMFGDFNEVSAIFESNSHISGIEILAGDMGIAVATGRKVSLIDPFLKQETSNVLLEHPTRGLVLVHGELLALQAETNNRSSVVKIDFSQRSAEPILSIGTNITHIGATSMKEVYAISEANKIDFGSRARLFDISNLSDTDAQEAEVPADDVWSEMFSSEYGKVNAISFHERTGTLAIGYQADTLGLGDEGGRLQIIRSETDREFSSKILEVDSGVTHLATSEEGNALAVATSSGRVQFFDLTLESWTDLEIEVGGELREIDMSRDGKFLLVSSLNPDFSSSLREYQILPSRLAEETSLTREQPKGSTFIFSKNDEYLATLFKSKISVYSAKDWEIKQTYNTTGNTTEFVGFRFSGGGPLLDTIESDGTVGLGDLTLGSPFRFANLHPNLRGLKFSHGGRYFAFADGSERVLILDLDDTEKEPCVFETPFESEIEEFVILEDVGSALISLSHLDGVVTLETEFTEDVCPLEFQQIGPSNATNFGSTKLLISLDGERVLSLTKNLGSTFLYDTSRRSVIRDFPRDAVPSSASFGSTDTKFAVIGYENGTVEIIDTDSGDILKSLQFQSAVNSLGFSGPGSYLAISLADRSVRIFQFDTLTERARLEFPSAIDSIEFSPSGEFFLTRSELGVFRVHSGYPAVSLFDEIQKRLSNSWEFPRPAEPE